MNDDNKMAEIAKLFNKELGERFTVLYDNYQFSCYFSDCGFCACGVYDNPYLDFDPFILQDLLTGRAVIIDA
jgi:hypothetical protein